LTFVTATPTLGTYDPGTGLWDIGAVAFGAQATLILQTTVQQAGAITNNAAKTAQGESDPVGSNDAAGVTLNGQEADVQVVKTVDNTTPLVNENVTFTVTVTNNGPSTATGVEVTDTLPAGLSLVTDTPSQGSFDTATGIWAVGTLASMGAGATATLQLTATVTEDMALTNVAVKTAQDQPDPNPTNDQGSIESVGQPVADLRMTKTDGVTSAVPGTSVTYTIVVTNAGPSNATAVSLSDALPAGTTFVSLDSPGGWACTTPAVGANGSISCSIASLGVGSTAFTLAVRVGASVSAELTNTATVVGAVTDPNTANNSATATTAVDSLPTTAQGDAGGGLVTAAITGGTCASFAPGSTAFTPAPTPLPPGITFSYGVFGFTAVCPPGGTVTLTLTYPNPLPAGTQYWKYGPTSSNPTAHWYVLPPNIATITGNTAVFTITDGGLGDDDLVADGDIVDQGGPGVPGVGSGAATIPTLSEWALILLSVLLGGLFWRAKRRVD
jgi:uncharacterized repeat protein (TIGR01451 family)